MRIFLYIEACSLHLGVACRQTKRYNTRTLAAQTLKQIVQYKQYIRPILTYAPTAEHPDPTDTHLNKLQVTQNAALRTGTAGTSSTTKDHLQTPPTPAGSRGTCCSRWRSSPAAWRPTGSG